MAFSKAAGDSSRFFTVFALIFALLCTLFVQVGCTSDSGTRPVAPVPTEFPSSESPEITPTACFDETSATYELFYFENRRLEQCVREQLG